MKLNVGDKAPEFSVLDESGRQVALKAFRGKKVVLYFYPKDNTPGCTQEACDFRDNLSRIQEKNAVVLAVSRDSDKAHLKFKEKYDLSFPLLVDTEGKIAEAYDVLAEKSLFGKKFIGISRVTFLIDQAGCIEKIWRKVKVSGHVEEILRYL